MRWRGLLSIVLVLFIVGCVEGEPRFFEDESAKVERLRVNAFWTTDDPGATVEVHGHGPDGQTHAFTGTVRLALEAQDRTTEPHTYRPVKEWTVEVDADDFSTPTIPFFTYRIPPADLPGAGTYRVWANASIGERAVVGEPALFERPA